MMKAVFLEKAGGPLVMRLVKVPEPGPGEVIVKMSAAPVNPSDLAQVRSAPDRYDLAGFIPGLEGSGRVVAAGKGLLPHLWLGKRVACSVEYHTSGTWAEYMVTKAGKCFPIGKKVTDEQGSMSLVNPLTAIEFIGMAKKGSHKAIINNAAASALGRMIELLSAKEGISLINIVRSELQVARLRELGAKHVLDSSQESFLSDLGALAKELNATLLFDSVCSRQLEEMCDVLPYGSTLVIYGNLSGEEEVLFRPRTLISNNIRIEGFYLANSAKENGLFKNMMNLRKVGTLMSTDMSISIRGRYPLSEVQAAVESYLGNMSAGKVLLVM